MTTHFGWIGVDLDGTLAQVDHNQPYVENQIGEPVARMVEFVQDLMDNGYEVRIFTARAAEPDLRRRLVIEATIRDWCIKVFGKPLPITCVKDYQCICIYDDRARQVIYNQGVVVEA